mgnify:FL=1
MEADARLIAAAPEMKDALALPLLFHAGGEWSGAKRATWKRVTGTDEATTKVMCDTIRAALRKATEPA